MPLQQCFSNLPVLEPCSLNLLTADLKTQLIQPQFKLYKHFSLRKTTAFSMWQTCSMCLCSHFVTHNVQKTWEKGGILLNQVLFKIFIKLFLFLYLYIFLYLYYFYIKLFLFLLLKQVLFTALSETHCLTCSWHWCLAVRAWHLHCLVLGWGADSSTHHCFCTRA